jgi:hypothetical protein
LGVCAVVALLLVQANPLSAQPAPGGIIAPGFPIVTGFSGVRPGAPAAPPGAQPFDKTFIDPDGPSLRVVDAARLGGSPRAQLVPAAKPFTVTAAQIGQVFAVALDDALPPNIYAAATSAYGLPIVVPDADGDGLPERARTGAPNAQFMPSLFGPGPDAGPGTIWKISPHGEVSIFANVTLDGAANSGAALGGLAFDPASRQLFVADRGTGMIHAFGLDGRETARFDHGAQGLGAIGLPPLAFDPRNRLDIRSSGFDPSNSSTWAYAPPSRRVFGLAVHRGRLYYAVAAGLRIWSVSIAPDGSFGPDARVEMVVPPGPLLGGEIAKILFDDSGAMLVAERGPPTGAYDFGALTSAGLGRVLRLRPKQPDEQGTPFLWQLEGEYAIGFPPDHRNADGGIALGYGYDAEGFAVTAACGGTLWSTGSQLRLSPDPSVAQRLAENGALAVDGLQANALPLLRPQNVPPQSSYFVDYDDRTERAGTSGHMGDVATWRFCPPAFFPQIAELLLEEILCLPGRRYRAGRCEPPDCDPRRQRCDPPDRRRPDLTIRKVTIRCAGVGQCIFQLIVTNVGEGTYSGPIAVGDQVVPGQVTSITPPSADWQCASYPNNIFTCINPNATLQPNQSVSFTVNVTIPATLRGRWKNCGVVAGDPAKETNWSNNKSCVEGDRDRPKPDGTPDLKIVKIAPKSCTQVSQTPPTYRCEFTVRVSNEGTADYVGEVRVADEPLGGGRIIEIGADGWTCSQSPNVAASWQCRKPDGLRRGETQTIRVVTEFVVQGSGPRELTNCARLGEYMRDGSLPLRGRTRLAASAVPWDLLRRLAEGPLPPSGNDGPPSGQAPPVAPPVAQPPGGNGVPPGQTHPTSPLACASVTVQPTTSSEVCAPGLIAVRQPSGPPRCCTPEAVAAGACLPPPSCQPPSIQVGDRCCTPDDVRSGRCGPPPSCQPPSIKVGDRCCTPEDVRSGRCGPLTVDCPPGQFHGDDGRCYERPIRTCPTGLRLVDGQCVKPDGKVRVCRTGFVWDGRRCVRGTEKPKPKCQPGFHFDGRRCVSDRPKAKPKPKCQAGLLWDGRRCVPPAGKKQRGVKPIGPSIKPGTPIRRVSPPVTPVKPITRPPQRGR